MKFTGLQCTARITYDLVASFRHNMGHTIIPGSFLKSLFSKTRSPAHPHTITLLISITMD